MHIYVYLYIYIYIYTYILKSDVLLLVYILSMLYRTCMYESVTKTCEIVIEICEIHAHMYQYMICEIHTYIYRYDTDRHGTSYIEICEIQTKRQSKRVATREIQIYV